MTKQTDCTCLKIKIPYYQFQYYDRFIVTMGITMSAKGIQIVWKVNSPAFSSSILGGKEIYKILKYQTISYIITNKIQEQNIKKTQ